MRSSLLALVAAFALIFVIAGEAVGMPLEGSAAAPDDAFSTALAFSLEATWTEQPRAVSAGLPWLTGNSPAGIDVTADGRVFAIDATARTVRAYNADGELRSVLGAGAGLLSPRDVAELTDGGLAISDPGTVPGPESGRLVVLRADGSSERSWDIPDPQGIAAAGDDIAVVSRAARELRIYRRDGRLLRAIDLDAERLTAPEGLSARGSVPGSDPPIRIFDVADPASGQLRAIRDGSSMHTRLLSGLPGVRAGALWTERESNYWLAVVRGRGLVIAGESGGVIDESPLGEPVDVAVAADGTAYVSTMPDGVVRIADIRHLLDRETDTWGRLLAPQRIAVGSEALVADRAPRVQAWGLDGRPGAERRFKAADDDGAGFPETGPDFLPEEDLSPALDVAAGGSAPDDPRYVLWRSGRVRRMDDGVFTRVWQPGEEETAWPTAIDADGDRVAVLDLAAGSVRMLDSDLRSVREWPVSDALGGVADIAISAGTVWTIDERRWTLEGWSDYGVRTVEQRLPGRPIRVATGAGPGPGASGRVFVLTRVGWVHAFDERGEPAGAWPAVDGSYDERPTDLDVGADGRLYVSDAAGRIRVYTPDAEAPPGEPGAARPGECAAGTYKTARPSVIEIGETVEVQLIVDGVCPSDDDVVDVVMTVDRSGSMYGTKIWAAKNAAIDFVGRIEAPRSRLGLVTFSSDATRDLGLTESRLDIIRAIAGVRAGGSTNLVDALDTARRTMLDAPLRPADDPEARRVIVFLSDGRHQIGSVPIGALEAVIGRVRDARIEVFTIGLGADADAMTLARMASDDSHYYFSPSESELEAIYDQIAGRISRADLFEDAVVIDQVPANMTYLPGTGRPIEPAWNPGTRTLRWHMGRVPAPGFRLSYELRPDEPGVWPTNVRARTDHVDGRGEPGSLEFPIPYVRVIAPIPTPTPTIPPSQTPSPTSSPTPTSTPSPTPTERPSPTPTPSPSPPSVTTIYLPIARSICQLGDSIDIVMVIDTSTSMLAATRDGGLSKLAAAAMAARTFVDLLDNPNDRVAVVQFNDSAEVLSGLRVDRNVTREALGRVHVSPGTRIDAGLEAADAVMSDPGRDRERRGVVVLLTDGRPTVSRASLMILAAERLKTKGFTLFAIGLGPDADPELLSLAATAPPYYLFAPDAEDLERLYRRIAGQLAGCTGDHDSR